MLFMNLIDVFFIKDRFQLFKYSISNYTLLAFNSLFELISFRVIVFFRLVRSRLYIASFLLQIYAFKNIRVFLTLRYENTSNQASVDLES